jgi:phosphate:Na+ symporter
MALAGFGLFFIGIDLMKGAFESFADNLDLASFGIDGFFGLVLYVFIGMLMTVLTQSSSAAIAITLTAATGGVLSIDAAAATVIGANVGTTSTAAFAVIGATANARRVAGAHVVFNLATGGVALVLLPFLLWIVRATSDMLGLEDVPAITLALFHTAFNLLGVALMLPLTTRLVRFLEARFTTQAELVSRLQFLDANVLEAPTLALEALRREIVRALSLTRDLTNRSLVRRAPDRDVQALRLGVATLCDQIAGFIARIGAARLPDDRKGDPPQALRIVGYIEEVTGLLDDFSEALPHIDAVSHASVIDAIERFLRHVARHVLDCDAARQDFADGPGDERYRELRAEWRALKGTLLEAASHGTVPVQRLTLALEGLRATLRIAEQMTKAAERMRSLAVTAGESATDRADHAKHEAR